MNRSRRLGLACLLSFGGGPLWSRDRPRLLRALIESWPPYLYLDEEQKVRGLDAELLEAICLRAGYQLVWISGSAQRRKRRYLELLNDRFDVVFSATPADTGQREVMFTETYRHEVMLVAAIAGRSSQWDQLRSFSDLLTHRVSLLCVEAMGLGKDFEAIRPRLERAGLLVPYSTARQGIEMLQVGRAPLILGDALDLQEQAHALGIQLVRQPYGLSETRVSLMLSRKRLDNADLARINRAIAQLEREGTLGSIRNRYLAVPSLVRNRSRPGHAAGPDPRASMAPSTGP